MYRAQDSVVIPACQQPLMSRNSNSGKYYLVIRESQELPGLLYLLS